MNLDLTEEELAFRGEARTWLRENLPTEERPPEGQEMRAFDLAWQRTLYDGGWAGISWPVDFGGRGLSDIQQMIWYEEFARANPPFTLNNSCTFVGNNHGGPTIIVNGTDDQKATYLPPILRGEVVWCQGFSEPGAGSDLGSLTCRAEIDGDHLVVNGQKTWTSYAHVADLQELLVRTDPDAPKHKGISWVVCDMTTPGIEIREIRTMSRHRLRGLLRRVRIPVTNVVGGLHNGWRTADVDVELRRERVHGGSGRADLDHRAADRRGTERTDAHGRPLIGDEEVAPPGHRPEPRSSPESHDHRRDQPAPRRHARGRGVDDPLLPRRAAPAGVPARPRHHPGRRPALTRSTATCGPAPTSRASPTPSAAATDIQQHRGRAGPGPAARDRGPTWTFCPRLNRKDQSPRYGPSWNAGSR